MNVTLLGSGCAKGTPKIGCKCHTCLVARDNSFQLRRRFGLLIEEQGMNVLIDIGPDIKTQLLDLDLGFDDIDHVFITHQHYDHIGGIGEIYASNRIGAMNFYGANLDNLIDRNGYRYLVDKGNINPIEVKPFETIDVGQLLITAVPLNHGIPTYGYVVIAKGSRKKVVIACDTNSHIPNESLARMQNPDIFFVDAWADEDHTAYSLVKELYPANNKCAFVYNPEFLFHLLINESKSLSEKINAKVAVGVHIGHLCPPHEILVNRHETDQFKIGYDLMRFTFQTSEISNIPIFIHL